VRCQKRDVYVRARIWDGNHERVLLTLPLRSDGAQPGCPDGRKIALLGGADFSDVYVDPWDARWVVPEGQGTFTWDTRRLPEGDYTLKAVVDLQDHPPTHILSDFKVAVRH
jgi:hypothetical protein